MANRVKHQSRNSEVEEIELVAAAAHQLQQP